MPPSSALNAAAAVLNLHCLGCFPLNSSVHYTCTDLCFAVHAGVGQWIAHALHAAHAAEEDPVLQFLLAGLKNGEKSKKKPPGSTGRTPCYCNVWSRRMRAF